MKKEKNERGGKKKENGENERGRKGGGERKEGRKDLNCSLLFAWDYR